MTRAKTLHRTALHQRHVNSGAKLVEFAGWEMPVQYSGVIDEHRAVRQAAGLFDVSHMGELGVIGLDAEAVLQRLTPNDVSKLQPGRAHYSGLLTEQGTYVDDLLVYRLAADEFLLVVNAANKARDLEWITGHVEGEVEVTDRSADMALLALQGPQAEGILQGHTEVELGAIRYYRFREGEVFEKRALISRTGYTGEDGFELYLSPTDAPDVWDRLLGAGEARGLVPAGLAARDTLRLEAAMVLYGHEIDDTTTPFEAGLDWVVKLEKGDFIGRHALETQRSDGVDRRLIGFEVTGKGIARQDHKVVIAGEDVGKVTSGTWSPTLETALGMAYVPSDLASPGARIGLEGRGRLLEARIVELPFYKRS